jgi:hypothetical protein
MPFIIIGIMPKALMDPYGGEAMEWEKKRRETSRRKNTDRGQRKSEKKKRRCSKEMSTQYRRKKIADPDLYDDAD